MPAPVLKRCGHCGGLIRRRGAHSGRFLPPAARDAAPLLHAAPAGSERIAKGNRTRAARARARQDAMTARLRAEIAAGIAPVKHQGEEP